MWQRTLPFCYIIATVSIAQLFQLMILENLAVPCGFYSKSNLVRMIGSSHLITRICHNSGYCGMIFGSIYILVYMLYFFFTRLNSVDMLLHTMWYLHCSLLHVDMMYVAFICIVWLIGFLFWYSAHGKSNNMFGSALVDSMNDIIFL